MDPRRQILQLKIQLREIKPVIWRRVEVPAGYSFWDLHVAIQDAMGWLDCHLHAFWLKEPLTREEVRIGIPDPGGFVDEPTVLPGWEIPVTSYFKGVGDRARYEYDYGDDWQHDVVLEAIGVRQPKTKYPRCLAGARACPPEDCGGPPGYDRLLATIANPRTPEAKSLLQWLGGPFDPEVFDAGRVRFANPKQRWKVAFGPR